MQRQSGFSIIELLVSIAIVLIMVAVLAPSVIASIQAGNESATAQNLRAFAKAESAYQQIYPQVGFSASPANLGGPVAADKCPSTPDPTDTEGQWSCLLPDVTAQAMANGQGVSGYIYSYTKPTSVGGAWALTAVPSSSMRGRRSYCIDASQAIYYITGMTAPTVDPASNSCTSGNLLGF